AATLCVELLLSSLCRNPRFQVDLSVFILFLPEAVNAYPVSGGPLRSRLWQPVLRHNARERSAPALPYPVLICANQFGPNCSRSWSHVFETFGDVGIITPCFAHLIIDKILRSSLKSNAAETPASCFWDQSKRSLWKRAPFAAGTTTSLF